MSQKEQKMNATTNATQEHNITIQHDPDVGPHGHHIKLVFLLYSIPLALMAIAYLKSLINFIRRRDNAEVNNNNNE